jgi:hypothetical protein
MAVEAHRFAVDGPLEGRNGLGLPEAKDGRHRAEVGPSLRSWVLLFLCHATVSRPAMAPNTVRRPVKIARTIAVPLRTEAPCPTVQ